MKVALIGIGGMGKVHFDVYKSLENVEIVGVCDIRVEMAEKKVNNPAIPVFADYKEMLEKVHPDIVDVVTPSYLHADMAVYCLEHGYNVICEKPMSVNSYDCDRMIQAAKKSGKKFMIAHVVRFMANYKYLRSVIESGELGKPVHFIMRRLSQSPFAKWENWMLDTKKSGGVTIDLSVHDLDFIQSIFGNPKSISAVYRDMKDDTNFIDTELTYDGFTCNVIGTWYKTAMPFAAEFTAVFENGVVELKNGVLTKNGEKVDVKMGLVSEAEGMNITTVDGYGDEIEYFIDCVEKNKDITMVTPESSRNSIALCEAILLAAKKI